LDIRYYPDILFSLRHWQLPLRQYNHRFHIAGHEFFYCFLNMERFKKFIANRSFQKNAY
jgi:hypothetical protein